MAETQKHVEGYTEAEAADMVAFADAALGAAGHEVTDPYLDELTWQFVRGEITGDEARERGRKYILGR